MAPVHVVRGYELQERIGAGGFGEVYRAYQPSVGRQVAIKIILPQYASHPEFVRRFEAEARLDPTEHSSLIVERTFGVRRPARRRIICS